MTLSFLLLMSAMRHLDDCPQVEFMSFFLYVYFYFYISSSANQIPPVLPVAIRSAFVSFFLFFSLFDFHSPPPTG